MVEWKDIDVNTIINFEDINTIINFGNELVEKIDEYVIAKSEGNPIDHDFEKLIKQTLSYYIRMKQIYSEHRDDDSEEGEGVSDSD